jgi:hypothetical protein
MHKHFDPKNNILVVSVSKKNINVALVITFLCKLIEVFTEYFKDLEEESVRDNFVVIYELLDEMMDFGYPQTTESRILQEYDNGLCRKYNNILLQVYYARRSETGDRTTTANGGHKCGFVAF